MTRHARSVALAMLAGLTLTPGLSRAQMPSATPPPNASRAELLRWQRQRAIQFLDAADEAKRAIAIQWLHESETPASVAVSLFQERLRTAWKEARIRPSSDDKPAFERWADRSSLVMTLMNGFASYGPQARAAVPDLIRIVRDTQADTGLRDEAVRALGAIKVTSPDVVAALTAYLQEVSASYAGINAIVALGDMGRAARTAIPALEAALAISSSENSRQAYRSTTLFTSLGKITGAGRTLSTAAAIERISFPSRLAPGELAFALQSLSAQGRKAAAARPALLALVQQKPAPYYAVTAMETLGAVGVGPDRKAGAALISLFQQTLGSSSDTVDRALYSAIQMALQHTQPEDTGFLPALTDAIAATLNAEDIPKHYEQESLFHALARIGPRAVGEAPRLVALLEKQPVPACLFAPPSASPSIQKVDYGKADSSEETKIYIAMHERAKLYALLVRTGLPRDAALRQRTVALIQRDLEANPTERSAFFLVTGAARAARAFAVNSPDEAKLLVPTLIKVLRTPFPHEEVMVDEDGIFGTFRYTGGTTSPQIEAVRTLGAFSPAASVALPMLETLAQQPTPTRRLVWVSLPDEAHRAAEKIRTALKH